MAADVLVDTPLFGLDSSARVTSLAVDNDLVPDVALGPVVSNIDGKELLILLGDGDGGFLPSSSIELGGDLAAIDQGDFDGDGDEDLTWVRVRSEIT